MRSQRLWGTRFETPREVVRWLAALQAQEFAMAKWSVAQRTRGASKADVEQALADGVILRTHVLRPTWHFVLGEDIRWILKATAPRVHALTRTELAAVLQRGDRSRAGLRRLVGHWKPTMERNAVRIKTALKRPLSRVEAKTLAAAVGLTAAWMRGK
jgi:hypothetical protein